MNNSFESLFVPVTTQLYPNHPKRTELAVRFLNKDAGMPRYIVGCNAESELLRELIPISGLIDDGAPLGTSWHGVPIVAMVDVPKDACVLNASTSIAPVAVGRALLQAGHWQVLNLADLLDLPQTPAGLTPWFIDDQRAEMQAHRAQWLEFYDRLEDHESQKVLEDVVRFRLTANLESMARYEVRLSDQYFEDFLALSDEVFVDAGGFDGDTTEQFCDRVPNYRKVHFFEPSKANMAAARCRLKQRDRIEFHPIGLHECKTELGFNASSGSASSVTETGGERICVDRLDSLINEPVGFIKMDLEGWEMHALRGAARTIRHNRPKLAISVYHRSSHFREVSEFVLSLCPDYKLRLRHYTQGWSETVLFLTPN